MEILENLEPLLKTFWFVAIPTSLIFVIQMVMTFMGVDSSDGLEADFDGDLGGADAPFQLFSLRNLINFLLGFSWTGISFYTTIYNRTFVCCQVFRPDRHFNVTNLFTRFTSLALSLPTQHLSLHLFKINYLRTPIKTNWHIV